MVKMPVELRSHEGCEVCGFVLWKPMVQLSHSSLGLYSDARFPGRSILTLENHFESLDEVYPDTLLGFTMDIRRASRGIREATGCARVNVAILGNAVSHVHAHLIPRWPGSESRPHQSPWNDERVKTLLPEGEEVWIRSAIASALCSSTNLTSRPHATRIRTQFEQLVLDLPEASVFRQPPGPSSRLLHGGPRGTG